MKNFIATLLIAVGLFASASNAFGADTPEQVHRQYFETVRAKGMAAGIEYIHPDELARFQAMLRPMLTTETPMAKGLRLSAFGSSATAESVKAMDASAFMRGFLTMAQRQMKSMDINLGKSDIIGSVKEGEVVHLVTRSTAGQPKMQLTQMEVVSLKPYQDTWRLLLSGKLEGMAQVFKEQAGESSDP